MSKPKEQDYRWLAERILRNRGNANKAYQLIQEAVAPTPPTSDLAYVLKNKRLISWVGNSITLDKLVQAIPDNLNLGDISLLYTRNSLHLDVSSLVPNPKYELMLKDFKKRYEAFEKKRERLEEIRIELINSIKSIQQDLPRIKQILPHLTSLRWSNATRGIASTAQDWLNFCVELDVVYGYNGRLPLGYDNTNCFYREDLVDFIRQEGSTVFD